MTTLQEKLKEILAGILTDDDLFPVTPDEIADIYVTEILEAVQAAGYHQVFNPKVDGQPTELLSGQEWYDRFGSEVLKMSERGGLLDGMGHIKSQETIEWMTEAAKRASGLED